MSKRNSALAPRPDQFGQMLDNGVAIANEIEADMQRLAEKMQRVHGTECRGDVDYSLGLILIRPV